MERTAWFCPACQKHHAPYVETCPGPVDVRPLPGITVPDTYPVMPRYWEPRLPDAPWSPHYPVVTCLEVRPDENTIVMNGVATTRAH